MSKEQFIKDNGNIYTGHTHDGGKQDTVIEIIRNKGEGFVGYDEVVIRATFEDKNNGIKISLEHKLMDDCVLALRDFFSKSDEEGRMK